MCGGRTGIDEQRREANAGTPTESNAHRREATEAEGHAQVQEVARIPVPGDRCEPGGSGESAIALSEPLVVGLAEEAHGEARALLVTGAVQHDSGVPPGSECVGAGALHERHVVRPRLTLEPERFALVADTQIAYTRDVVEARVYATEFRFAVLQIDLGLERDPRVDLSHQPEAHATELGAILEHADAIFDLRAGVHERPVVLETCAQSQLEPPVGAFGARATGPEQVQRNAVRAWCLGMRCAFLRSCSIRERNDPEQRQPPHGVA